jgi:nondiscriminating aspartyl-tRNA synthetase
MKRVVATELSKFICQEVRVRGWLNNVRALGKVNFVVLRDRSGFIQVVCESGPEFDKVNKLQPGSILEIVAQVNSAPKADLGVELVSPKIKVEVAIDAVPPVDYYKPKMSAEIEASLDHRTVSLRNRQSQAVFRIQGEIAHAFRLYMHDAVAAHEYFGPCMIGAASEGGADCFTVDYFGYQATLAQSSQLYKQVMVGVNERVFAIMPFFRAENSNTVRHLTEGKQLEFEMGFFDNWREVLDVQEGLIKFVVKYVSERCQQELSTLGNPLVTVPQDKPFPRVTFAEAQEIVFKVTGIDERKEPDLSPAGERALCKWAREVHGTDCIFVTDWLTSKRPFYSYPSDNNPQLTNTHDLLCAGTEISSGGQRRHTYESMLEGVKLKGIDPATLEDYLSIFKFGMPPHGGFGIGLERLTMTLLQIENIREVSLFPSDPRRIAGNRIKAKIFSGSENVRNEIIRLLKKGSAEYKHLVHEATPTSADSARVRGTTAAEGIKAIVLRGKTTKKNYQFCVPSDAKLDMKLVADVVGERCEFEDAAVIKERFGLEPGGIPPFGQLFAMETYFDEQVKSTPRAAFNCGLTTESIITTSKSLVELVNPKFGNFVKVA